MNAFPIAISANCISWEDGMTLRDYFAAKIINGYISDPTSTNRPFAEVAEWAYKFADAMIEAREKSE
jgi:hypothetical protein